MMLKKEKIEELYSLIKKTLDKLDASPVPSGATLENVNIHVEPLYDEDTMDCIRVIASGLKVNAEAFKILAGNVRAEPIQSAIRIEPQGEIKIAGSGISID